MAANETTGPSIEQYIETRFNLLTVASDKTEAAVRERIDAVEAAGIQASKSLSIEITHAKNLLQTAQETSQRAADKSENTQHLHNIEANNWRTEYNKLKSEMVQKDEFLRLDRDFSAYRLEVSKLIAGQTGEKAGSREYRQDSKSVIALAISVATALIAIASFLLRNGT